MLNPHELISRSGVTQAPAASAAESIFSPACKSAVQRGLDLMDEPCVLAGRFRRG